MTKVRLENINELPRKILIVLIALVALIVFGTISFKLILDISFQKAFITTLESFALLYQAEVGAAKVVGIFITLFGVIVLWWGLWSIFDLLYEGNLGEYLKISDFLSKLKKMKNHYIIAGGGRVGEEIAMRLARNKKEYIIIEKDEPTILKLKRNKLFAMHGDVSDENVLKQAKIKDAKAIILAMPETEKNLIITLVAKELNPNIDVYARADKPAFVSKLKKAGAKVVIVPELVAAEKFLESID